jgi:hypothetical protein
VSAGIAVATWAIVAAVIVVIALGVGFLGVMIRNAWGEADDSVPPSIVVLMTVMVIVLAVAVAVVLFIVPGEANGLASSVDHRFTLLGHLLKGALLVIVALAVVALTVSAVSSLILRSAAVRRSVRRCGGKLVSDAHKGAAPANTIMGLVGNAVLWLSDSSIQIQDFRGEIKDVDPVAVSSALAGFLPDIGSPTPIGTAAPVDPRLEVAPFGAESVADDLAKALSDAPYGKAAAAILSLVERLVPREKLYVGGYLLSSPQRGLGVAMTLATANGNVVDSQMIWSGEFEPTLLSDSPAETANVSAPLALALASASWVTYALCRRSGRFHLDEVLDTKYWQSYALVRVGLQITHRPKRATRAIYARAVDLDATNRTAVFNLGLAESRTAEEGNVALARIGTRRLEDLYREVTEPRQGLSTLPLSIVFNLVANALNAYHLARNAPAQGGEQPAGDDEKERLRDYCGWLHDELCLLEETLAAAPADDQRWSEVQRALGRFEQPLLALWAGAAQDLDDPATPRAAPDAAQLADPGKRRAALAELLTQHRLGHRQLVCDYLETIPVDARTQYNLACYWAVGGDPDKALWHLRQSLETGMVGQGAGADPMFYRLRTGAHEAEFAQVISDCMFWDCAPADAAAGGAVGAAAGPAAGAPAGPAAGAPAGGQPGPAPPPPAAAE